MLGLDGLAKPNSIDLICAALGTHPNLPFVHNFQTTKVCATLHHLPISFKGTLKAELKCWFSLHLPFGFAILGSSCGYGDCGHDRTLSVRSRGLRFMVAEVTGSKQLNVCWIDHILIGVALRGVTAICRTCFRLAILWVMLIVVSVKLSFACLHFQVEGCLPFWALMLGYLLQVTLLL